MKKRLFITALSALSSTLLPAATQWTGSEDWSWNNPNNWDNGAPSSTNDAVISGVTGDITLSANHNIGGLSFEGVANHVRLYSTATTPPILNTSLKNLRFGLNSSGHKVTIEGVDLRSSAASGLGNQMIVGQLASDNELVVTGAGSAITIAASAGFVVSRVTATGSESANRNQVLVTNGASFSAGTLSIGTDGVGNTFTVTGNGSRLNVTGGTNFNLDVGSGTKANGTNKVAILDQATATVTQSIRLFRGELHIGSGASVTTALGVQIGHGGKLSGEGNLTGNVQFSNLGSGSGAVAEIGKDGIGRLEVSGNWLNTSLDLRLDIGDLSASTTAGVGFDHLALNGTFTLGGTLTIDLAQAAGELPGNPLRLIAWNAYAGAVDDLEVRFINGAPLLYSIENDGLYLQSVPEPGVTALLIGGGLLGFGWMRRRR